MMLVVVRIIKGGNNFGFFALSCIPNGVQEGYAVSEFRFWKFKLKAEAFNNSLPWEGCGWMCGSREGFLRLNNPYLPFPEEGIALPTSFLTLTSSHKISKNTH
jgi:hypothetical protein